MWTRPERKGNAGPASALGTSLPNPLEGDVMVETFLGKRYQYNVSTALGEMVVSTDQERIYHAGERVTLSLAPNKIILI